MSLGAAKDDIIEDASWSVPMSEHLAHSLRVLRRRWLIIAIVPVVALVFSVALSTRATTHYVATSKLELYPYNPVNVLVNPASNPTSADPERDENTEVSEITEMPMASIVRSALHLKESSTSLLQDVSASLEGTTNIVDIKVTDSDATQAAAIANAFANHYVTYDLDIERSQIQSGIASARSALNALSSTQRSSQAGSQLQDKIASLQGDLGVATSDASVIENAATPTAPAKSKTLIDGLIAIFAGLLVGIVAAVALELLDRSTRDVDEAEALAGVPLLGKIPRPRRAMRALRGRVRLAPNPEQHATYGSLAVSVSALNLARDANVLMITASEPCDGTTSVTLGLAFALAELGVRVTVVEANMRRPRVTEHLGIAPAANGLGRVLAGRATLAGSIIECDLRTHWPLAPGSFNVEQRVLVLPAGPVPPHPPTLLSSPELGAVLDELRASADIVLIDAPPLGPIKDALLIAAWASRAVIVARVQHTARDALGRCGEELQRHDVDIAGLVVLGSPRGELRGYVGRARRRTSQPRRRVAPPGDGAISSPTASANGERIDAEAGSRPHANGPVDRAGDPVA